MLQQADRCPALFVAAAHHYARFEFDGACAREDGAAAAVEEGIVFKKGDGGCGDRKRRSAIIEKRRGVKENVSQGKFICFLRGRREIAAGDVAGAAIWKMRLEGGGIRR